MAQVLIPGVIGPAIGAAVLHNAATVTNSDGTVSFIPDERIFLAAFLAGVATLAVLFAVNRILKKDTKGGK